MNSGGQDPQSTLHHRMVQWYNPALLLRAGVRAVTAKVIGQIADNRELQAALDPVGESEGLGVHDYSDRADPTGFWIDYVADLGDGWDATYGVAQTIAQDHLSLAGHELRRGELLIMGGDAVYPDPSNDGYKERAINPYRAACAEVETFDADLFALPGNHDWYDGLQEFKEVFCGANRHYSRGEDYKFGSWITRQTRSYFALKLPKQWWLCGIDVQLGQRLNVTQLDYFQAIAESLMAAGDRVILCVAVPSWVTEALFEPGDSRSLVEIAEIFERAGAETKLVLTGDLHHYSHYKPRAAGPHLLTAGGGGAFLHPTHKLPNQTQLTWKDSRSETFDLAAVSPTRARSHRLSYRNLLFAFTNWDFALMIGGIYAVLSWFLETRTQVGPSSLSQMFQSMMAGHVSLASTLTRFFETIPKSPEFALLVLFFCGVLVYFNRPAGKVGKLVFGLAHALVHFVALVVAFCIAAQVTFLLSAQLGDSAWMLVAFLLVTLIVGGLLGGFVFGSFLLISLNIFGMQWTNAFSSLRITGYKCFVRLHIDDEGTLTVYPVEIERTQPDPSPPDLIEDPLKLM